MKKILELAGYVLIGAALMAGMKIVDHLVASPDINVLICITTKNDIKDCKPLSETESYSKSGKH